MPMISGELSCIITVSSSRFDKVKQSAFVYKILKFLKVSNVCSLKDPIDSLFGSSLYTWLKLASYRGSKGAWVYPVAPCCVKPPSTVSSILVELTIVVWLYA